MRLHGNAELSLNKRRGLVRRVEDEGWTLREASEAAEVSVRTARKWVRRYRSEGEPGLALARDRPPNSPLHPTQVGLGHIESHRQTHLMLTAFGATAVTFMVVMYAFESRDPRFILAFACGCLLSSVYGFLAGVWPFGVVEAIWAAVAVQRYRRRVRE